jgi:hypothetical protein
VSPVKYELGFYIPEDDILHSNCGENLKSYLLIPPRHTDVHFLVLPLYLHVNSAVIFVNRPLLRYDPR